MPKTVKTPNRIPRFHLPPQEITKGAVTIRGQDFRHIVKSLRLGVGSALTLFGGTGIEYGGVITSVGPRFLEVRICSSESVDRESPLRITLFQAIARGEKMDAVIEKTTELGVSAIVPVITERTQVKGTRRVPRWRRVAVEAAKQSGRTSPPEVFEPVEFAQALEMQKTTGPGVLFYERGKKRFSSKELKSKQSVSIFTGPEGGFSEAEVEEAHKSGCRVHSLGPRILRTETAGIVAVALLQHALGDL
ncbi:MAG: 16S rRNA (uracil(1498)-N(3))-methyltransferase [Candidatus Dadabacteria bacterium]|nr:16S rRNA (uracil(1498)-N(3))-methyltransferase [Candidatus Dadabacteria bacterium]